MDVNSRGMWDNTPLICACQYRHAAVALALCEAGADVTVVNEKGNTALLHAALEGLEDVVQALLARGAPVHVPASVIYNSESDSNQVLTPLVAAVVNNRAGCVRALVAAGAFTGGSVAEGPIHPEAAAAAARVDQPYFRSPPLALAQQLELGEVAAVLAAAASP